MNDDFCALLRKLIPDKIATELVGVQPFPRDLFQKMMKEGLSSDELKDQGYRPVSDLGLLWTKDAAP